MKKYYIYVANRGIVTELFDHKETNEDILCTLIEKYGVDLIGYDNNLTKIQRLFLDSIYYETYKI